MVRPHRKAFQSNLHGLTSYERLNLQKNIAAKQKWIFVRATVNVCVFLHIVNVQAVIIVETEGWLYSSESVKFVSVIFQCVYTRSSFT